MRRDRFEIQAYLAFGTGIAGLPDPVRAIVFVTVATWVAVVAAASGTHNGDFRM